MWRKIINLWTCQSLLEKSWNESFDMLEIDHRMYTEAVRILRKSEGQQVNEDIAKLDRKVNKYEREVRRNVMTHCAVGSSLDLPSAMVLISIVIDIERVGDYCKNITQLAQAHPEKITFEPFEAELTKIEEEVSTRFKETIDILRDQDVERARALMATYRNDVAKVCDNIVEKIIKGESEEMSVAEASTLALYTRYLKRISSHLNNMVTSVVNPFDRIGYIEKKPKTVK
jgi:phosphate transport system protein